MTWRRPGDKPLSEPMMVSLLTHICITRPQWIKPVMNPYWVRINIYELHLLFKHPDRSHRHYHPHVFKWKTRLLPDKRLYFPGSKSNRRTWILENSCTKQLKINDLIRVYLARIFLLYRNKVMSHGYRNFSNHWPLTCLVSSLYFKLTTKGISNLRITCPLLVESTNDRFPSESTVMRKAFPGHELFITVTS